MSMQSAAAILIGVLILGSMGEVFDRYESRVNTTATSNKALSADKCSLALTMDQTRCLTSVPRLLSHWSIGLFEGR